MWTARNGAHQRLVEIFHGLNEMRLAEDEVGGVRLDDRHHGEFHGCAAVGGDKHFRRLTAQSGSTSL